MNRIREFLQSRRCFWWILAIAWLLRAGYALRLPLDERDAVFYRTLAHNLIAGHGYTTDGVAPCVALSPLAPWLIAMVYTLGGGEVPVRELWAVLGVLGVWAAWRLAGEWRGPLAANLAAAGMAFYPYNLIMGGSTSTETPNILLVFLTLLYVQRWLRDGRLAQISWAGIFLGLAALNRPSAAVFVPLGGALLWLRPRSTALRVRLLGSALFVVLSALVFAPWSVRTSRVTGSFCLVTNVGPMNLWFGINPWVIPYTEGRISGPEFYARVGQVTTNALTDAQRNQAYREALRRYVRENPGEVLALLAYKTFRFWQIPGVSSVTTVPQLRHYRLAVLAVGCVSYVPLLVIAVLGVVWLARRQRLHDSATFLVWIGVSYLTNVPFTAITRYRYANAIDAMLIVLAAGVLADWLASRRRPVGDERETIPWKPAASD